MAFRKLKAYQKGFNLACQYISEDVKNELEMKNIEIGKLLNYMINNPEKFV